MRRLKTPYGELGELMYHIFDSPNYWLDHLTKEVMPLKDYKDITSVAEFYEEWKKVDERLIKYLEENDGKINYKLIVHIVFEPGNEADIRIEDILMHISHHSFYHRGQLATIVRNTNLEPLPMSNWSFG